MVMVVVEVVVVVARAYMISGLALSGAAWSLGLARDSIIGVLCSVVYTTPVDVSPSCEQFV